jgi:hypothetical protein
MFLADLFTRIVMDIAIGVGSLSLLLFADAIA